jgi:unsaturated rhamnogalacturonyl hydrolase
MARCLRRSPFVAVWLVLPPLGGAPEPAPGPEPSRWSARTCDSVMKRSPVLTEKWTYDAGLVLRGCEQVWRATGDRRYLQYIKQNVDRFVDGEGKIRGYRVEDYNIDNINMGKVLFALHAGAESPEDKQRYRAALHQLRAQMQTHPRTAEGGFWHKKIYPHQMWLDGIYMASPFLAQFAVVFDEPALLDDVAKQVLLIEKHTRDRRSGLLYHGWDESRAQRWANPKTGTSPQFWGRALGWYAMGVVDVLGEMPARHPKRPALQALLARLASAIAKVQDRESGLWWQVLDAGARAGHYREAAAAAVFVYALSKAAKQGWIDRKRYGAVAERGYRGILAEFVETDPEGLVTVKRICKVAGLGGDPYRDGSYEYYTSTEVVPNDPKGVGAFILAAVEREAAAGVK